MTGPDRIYVFGCFEGGYGHHLYDAKRYPAVRDVEIERGCDSPRQTRKEDQIEGRIAQACHRVPGWSYVSWWDRQGDERHSSHTGILAKGDWTPEQLIEAGRRLAPWAFRVEVKP